MAATRTTTTGMVAMATLAILAAGCDAPSTARSTPAGAAKPGQAAPAASGKRSFNAGMWEITTKLNGQTMPPSRTCVGAAEAGAINGSDASVASELQRTTPKGCQIRNVVVAGSRVTFDTICQGQTVTSSISYAGDRYDGTMTVEGAPKMDVSGRRVGACSAGR